jgi:hypothetical protein
MDPPGRQGLRYISACSAQEARLANMMRIEQEWPEIVVFRRSERWKQNLYTQFETIVRLDSIGYAAPLAAFYHSNPFPEDVQRPWYHLNRIED